MFAPPINHLSQEEHNSAIEEMKTFEGLAFEPSVGIFWFDPDKGELFDTASCPVSTLNPKLDTISVLHKNIWTKNYYRAKARGKTDSIYFTDYTQIPRGRIFYNRKTKAFSVKVGHWIEQYEKILTPLLQEEFNLTEFSYDIDIHWDLGHGWTEHNFNVDAE